MLSVPSQKLDHIRNGPPTGRTSRLNVMQPRLSLRVSRATLWRQMDEEIRRKILTLLDQHRIMTIATLRPDGWPQATTRGYANEGLTLYFLCGPDSQKAANLARDDRVSLTIDHDTPQVMEITGLSMAARASCGRSDRSGEGLALAHAEVSAAGLLTTANGGCPHIPRDPDGDLRARLLQGLRTHRSRHVLEAFPAAS